MSDEDDKATVVIDLNRLKKEKEQKQQELDDVAEHLEFNLSPNPDDAHESAQDQADDHTVVKPLAAQPKVAPLTVVMFEFGKDHFAKLKPSFPAGHQYHLVSTLPELNGWLKKKVPIVLCLPLDVNPKSVNQLCVQLHAKFPHAKVVLVSKALSAEKIAIHKKSPARAAAYLGYPFKTEELGEVLAEFTQSKIA